MNIGLALLYLAFAVVALWLLGELLVQHRAPAHWRALALLGFLGLVAGVHQGSAAIVAVGVLAFGAGQGMVTRSVKRGDGPHWSLRGPDGGLPGPLGRVPLVAQVFPAEGIPEAAVAADPARRVGTVGPIEDEAAEPVPAQPESAAEFVESQPYDGEPEYDGGLPGARIPQQTTQPYPQEYAYPYQAAEAVPPGFAQPAGYDAGQYQQEYAAQYAQQQPYAQQEYAQQPYAQQEYGQQEYAQQPYPQSEPGGYYGDSAPGYGYEPAAQPQPQQGYYQQPAPDDYDAVGYDPQGTYQYDYRPPAEYQPHADHQAEYQQQPQQHAQPGYGGEAVPEPWTYG